MTALEAEKPVSYFIRHDQPERLQSLLAAVHPEAHVEGQGVRLSQGTLPSAVDARYRTASFLIDADQPSITELSAKLEGKPTRTDVTLLTQISF